MAHLRPISKPPLGSAMGYWNPAPGACPGCRGPIEAFWRECDGRVGFVRCKACEWFHDLRPKRLPIRYRRAFRAIIDVVIATREKNL